MNRLVLVVDDDPAVLSLVALFIREGGYDVLTAASGQDALGILAEQHVDLLITDLVMPEMDGAELVRRARRLGAVSRFLVMSGYADMALEPGTPLLRKPFTPEELLSRIEPAVTRKMPQRASAMVQANGEVRRTEAAG